MRVIDALGMLAALGASAVFAAHVPAQRAAPSSPSSASPSTAQPSAAATEATSRIVASAQEFLKTLDDAARAKVQFPFDSPQKTKWSNLPTGIFKREGLRMGDLTPAQRKAVQTLLAAALSENGYRKVTEIVLGDEVLRTSGSGAPRGRAPGGGPPGGGPPSGGASVPGPGGQGPGGGGPGGRGPGGGGGPNFGEDEYYLAFLGAPSTSTPWMLQYGGHHLAINLTMAGSRAAMTPSLPAAQPATFTFQGREIRPLGKESDKAFALIAALDAAQRDQAVLDYRVSDLVLGPGQDGRVIQPEGVRASALTPAQQTMLMEIVREWAGIMADGYADARMTEIRANLADTWFAWSGPTTKDSAAYFRIQGPTVVIEYAPQGGSTDHIHTIYRDPTNDYGAKIASAK
jgi:hypothetical protein